MHKQLKIFLVSNSFFVLATGMLGPIYALFVKEIGGDILDAGFSWSIFMIISGAGMLVMGKIVDSLKKEKPMMILGYSLQSLGFLGYFFVSNKIQLYLLQILMGISITVQHPVFNSFYTRHLEKGKVAFQWAAWEGTYFITTGIAALIGAFLVKIFGFRTMFLIMFFVSLFGLFAIIKIKEK